MKNCNYWSPPRTFARIQSPTNPPPDKLVEDHRDPPKVSTEVRRRAVTEPPIPPARKLVITNFLRSF